MSWAAQRSSQPPDSGVGTAVRCAAAVAIAVGGLIHLQLYFDGYRDFPDANLGRSFVANGAASIVVACLLVARRDVAVRIAGAGILASTLIAFAVSRTDRGVFGLTERGLQPSPQAILTLVVEIVGLVLIAATFLPQIGPGDDIEPRVAAPIAAAALIATLAASALWARTPSESSDAAVATDVPSSILSPTTAPPAGSMTSGDPAPSTAGTASTAASGATTTVAPAAAASSDVVTIGIADFAFEPDGLEIAVGTTVEWVNNDSFAHNVIADDGSFASETLEEGDTFTFQFTEAGTFAYICGIHPQMVASVVVTG